MSEYQQWITSIKVGDYVATRSGYSVSDYWIGRVEKVTATQIHVGSRKYRKKDGELLGRPGFESCNICQVTDEIRRKVEQQRLTHKMKYMKWETATLEQMRQIDAILSPLANSAHGEPSTP